jgi:hypothetical protein
MDEEVSGVARVCGKIEYYLSRYTSTIKLGRNGKESSGKRTRHFDMKYFYVTDLISRDEGKIEYCSTHEMLADYNTRQWLAGNSCYFVTGT